MYDEWGRPLLFGSDELEVDEGDVESISISRADELEVFATGAVGWGADSVNVETDWLESALRYETGCKL